MRKNKPQLIVALDVDTFEEARTLIDSLSDVVDIFKVGSQLFTACGPVVIRHIISKNKKVFLDLKFHDIPSTVANAIHSAVGLCEAVHQVVTEKGQELDTSQGVFMCTVHTVGGEEMLSRAVEAANQKAESLKIKKPLIVGITVLTSEEKDDKTLDLVLERAKLAKMAGLDGVVSSSQEAQLIRQEMGDDFVIVTPGIRPEESQGDDQKRSTTPKEAIENGSNFLVVGRPIVKSKNPLEAAKNILEEIQSVLGR